jgi:hypothetical protein
MASHDREHHVAGIAADAALAEAVAALAARVAALEMKGAKR